MHAGAFSYLLPLYAAPFRERFFGQKFGQAEANHTHLLNGKTAPKRIMSGA